jgi:long-subunit acyl-CoA synthetase (AMP-forming)
LVYGNSLQNACVSIVVIEPEEVKKWAAANGKTSDLNALCIDEDLKKEVLDSMN